MVNDIDVCCTKEINENVLSFHSISNIIIIIRMTLGRKSKEKEGGGKYFMEGGNTGK
jgi:hypothetical protein